MAQVFHATEDHLLKIYGRNIGDCVALSMFNPKKYQFVAEVDAQTPEDVVRMTTHHKQNWWDNDGVRSEESIGVTRNARSTGKGDIIEIEGKWFFIDNNDAIELAFGTIGSRRAA